MYNCSYYGNYRQKKFTDVYGDADTFIADYTSSSIPMTLSENNARTLYYLLYSRYGNSTIASSDTNRFKYDLFATIYSYGPTWEKRSEIQENLRELSDTELLTGTTQIYNHAYNPGTAPSTATLDELTAINEQNTNKSKRDKMTAYSNLWSLLRTDVTEAFLDKFNKLFLIVVQPELQLWYVTDVSTEDVIGDDEDGN